MKIRTVLVAILGIVFISGMSLAQESAPQELASGEPLVIESTSPEPLQEEPASMGFASAEPRRGRVVQRSRLSNSETVMRIFVLQHYRADELEELIENLFSIDDDKIHANRQSSRLIIQATKKQMEDIEALIEVLDVPESRSESNPSFENFVYRVYMFEIEPEKRDMKPFSMIFQMPAAIPSTELLNMATDQGIQVSDFLIIDERNDATDVLVRGKAPSNESIQQLTKAIRPSQIRELKWDDGETFTSDIKAAHFSRLSGQLQNHIQKFLGDDIVTIGYWFGSLSVPGEVEAPIGPWQLKLNLKLESDRMLELYVDVETLEDRDDFDRRLGRKESDEIFSNTIRAKIGKPIIIGYNRESYGSQKMGAMVIIPESIELNASVPASQ